MNCYVSAYQYCVDSFIHATEGVSVYLALFPIASFPVSPQTNGIFLGCRRLGIIVERLGMKLMVGPAV